MQDDIAIIHRKGGNSGVELGTGLAEGCPKAVGEDGVMTDQLRSEEQETNCDAGNNRALSDSIRVRGDHSPT